MAAGGGTLQHANVNVNDTAAAQRGARLFVNYCMSCHSASYMRYQRLATDLDLDEEAVMENLVFSDAKIGDRMEIAMRPQDAAAWLGKAPPNLSLVARSRGTDWLYTYMRSFYRDDSKIIGVNNLVFPDVGMPHVLWELQGIQNPVYKYEVHHEGHAVESFDTEAAAEDFMKQQGEGYRLERVVDHLELVEPGSMTSAEYDQVARDLATFLTYISETMKLERQRMGVWVMLFLVVFTVLAYLTKKEWWKDIH